MASIFDLLLHGTTGDAHAWSLPNVKGEGRERWIGSRDSERLAKFCAKRDEPAFGTFFCVSTITPGTARKKENALELPFLFADIDFKDIDLEPVDIATIITNDCHLPPSRLHHTGNGIHAFWQLEAPILAVDMDRAEVLLRRLANHLGGDPQVAHRVALLRVPGTHNSKRGEWRPVRVLKEGRETYSLDQIDAWLDALRDPVLVRRGREQNPFLRTAQEQAFRAPVDVDDRLAAMRIGGEGDAGVHATQLSCTASLMSAGVDEDEAVATVLEATQAMAGTDGWDWRREEKTIREMCEDFLKKFPGRTNQNDSRATPRDITEALRPLASGTGTGNGPQPLPEGVVNLAQARKEREPQPEKELPKLSKKQKNEHVVIGKGIQEHLAEEGRRLMYADNQCWMYRQGVWTAMSVDEERSWASVMVERGCNAIKLVSNTKIVNETRAWLQRQPDMHKEDVPWDAHGHIATLDGLVDWRAGTLEPLRPEHYVTRLTDCGYDAGASCATWEAMLAEDYGFDEETVSFLQELLGVSLVSKKPRSLTRALVLLGPSNTGKSNVLNTFAGLISHEHNPTPLQALENSHGLMSFLKPNPWVLHEAFEQSRWEMSANAKALLSGDVVHVNVKNGPMLHVRFDQPVFWGTNVPPQFREASRAMENRLAIVQMRRAFNPLRIAGTAARALEEGYRTPAELVLATEKEGLLNWAIAGLKRAMARGHFVFTAEMQASLHAMRMDSNMASGFIEECCEHTPDHYVGSADFYGAFTVWWRDHRGGQVPSVDSLGRAMSSLSDPRILTGKRIGHKRVYAGLRMTDEGLDCWNAYSASVAAERSGLRISDRAGDVNRELGPEQLQTREFTDMQEAHRTWQPDGDSA